MKKTAAPLSFYESVFNKDTFFERVSAGSGSVLKASMAELVKDLRLKGVILGGESEAIFEDAKTQKTSFVKKGQTLGEMTVEEIREGSVLLSYLGEKTKVDIQ